MTDFPPTPQQDNILNFVRSSKSNLMIVARAGCGKTSTLKLIDAALPSSSAALLICFNKAIADSAKKSDDFRSATTIKTMNSIGHSIWAGYCNKRLTLDGKKILNIFKAIVDDADKSERVYLWSLYDTVQAAVNMARSIGYIPAKHAKAMKSIATFAEVEKRLDETPSDEIHDVVDQVLIRSIKLAYDGVVDFNDQVYMPALFGGIFPTFPTVMIDEYQDLSPVNRALVAKLCKNSRQIGVGDEAQAIYEFRGADSNAMPDAIARFQMETFPLSISFRCAEAITDNVHWHVPDIRSSNSGGIVETLKNADIAVGSAVICRYNAPLLHLALKLLSSGTRVDVAGVDIGNRVVKLLTKLGDESMTQTQTLNAIANWEAERESLDSKSGKDMAECMRVFARKSSSLGLAIAYAKHIFAETSGEVQFMSGHRSKGLEFDHVYHLDSKSIKRGGQEQNIHYVIDTRPRHRLTYIESEH